MMRALAIAFALVGCASPEGIRVESAHEPLIIEGDYGPPCSVRIEIEGHVYTFASWVGCAVLRRGVIEPEYAR